METSKFEEIKQIHNIHKLKISKIIQLAKRNMSEILSDVT